jgi:CBS domain-containing protein
MVTVQHVLERKGRSVFAVEPEVPVLMALKRMAEYQVGALLVMRNEQLVGIISERDYARKVILHGRSSSDTPVSQIMSAQVITVDPYETVQECMETMTAHRLRHLPVVERDRVIGVVSIGDLVKAVIEEQQQTIEQLESYIHS